jgi:hypothetical protein
MQYAVCSTKKEDVAKAIHEMVKNGQKIPIFQFGAKKYSELEKNRYTTPDACKKVEKEAIYVINLDTRKVHKKTCRCHGKNVVGARLCNLKTTGLLTCGLCMK